MAGGVPVWRLLLIQPQWLVEHAGAYASLAGQQAALALRALRRQAAWLVLALLCATLALGLGGVALMLWAVMSAALVPAHPWVLVLTPALPLVGAGTCWMQARRQALQPVLEPLRRQWALDRERLLATATPEGPLGWLALASLVAGAWLGTRERRPTQAP